MVSLVVVNAQYKRYKTVRIPKDQVGEGGTKRDTEAKWENVLISALLSLSDLRMVN